MKNKIHTLAILGICSALSIVLVLAIHFPLFLAAPFLEYDPADIPIFIGTLFFGPWAGLAMTAVVSIIQGITVSAQSGFIGILMHFFATGSFVIVAGLLAKRKKTFRNLVVSMSAGIFTMTIVMVLWNLIFTPIFRGTPRSAVISMLPVIILFNLIKATVNAVVAVGVYPPLSRFLKR